MNGPISEDRRVMIPGRRAADGLTIEQILMMGRMEGELSSLKDAFRAHVSDNTGEIKVIHGRLDRQDEIRDRYHRENLDNAERRDKIQNETLSKILEQVNVRKGADEEKEKGLKTKRSLFLAIMGVTSAVIGGLVTKEWKWWPW